MIFFIKIMTILNKFNARGSVINFTYDIATKQLIIFIRFNSLQ
jgi:hypothetical protein